MTKLIIQIPCLNEAESLERTIKDIPTTIEGVGVIETLLVDDGSTDSSADVARKAGITHVVQHSHNKGLAEAFRTGIAACLARGADIIVNFDGDGQYRGSEIAVLIAPVLNNEADIVVGNRRVQTMTSYNLLKRFIHGVGRCVVNRLGGLNISDPVSGFRAFNRRAAQELNVFSSFSYTTETLIQASNQYLRVREVPVSTNPTPRPSRLFRSVPHFVMRTSMTILRTYATYKPLKVFTNISLLFMVIGSLPIIRFLIEYFQDGGAGHVQSLILGASFIIMGFIALMFGIIADVQARNRQLMEQIRRQLQQLDEKLPSK